MFFVEENASKSVPIAKVPSALLALDLRVASDPLPAGFIGHLVVAVRKKISVYWSADFTRERFGFYHTEPAFCDALITLTAQGADALLNGRTPRRESITAKGDDGLVQRFVHRYGQTRTLLDVRATPVEGIS